MEKKTIYGLRKYGKRLVAVTLGVVGLGTTQIVSADEWVANTPDDIQIAADATSYQLKKGDTLWAVSQKVNVSVDTIAQLSNVNLTKGEQYHLPVGYTVRWSEETSGTDDKVVKSDNSDSLYIPDGTEVPALESSKRKSNKSTGNVKVTAETENSLDGLSDTKQAIVIEKSNGFVEVIIPVNTDKTTDTATSENTQSGSEVINTDDVDTADETVKEDNQEPEYLVLTAKSAKEAFTWAEFAKDKDIANEVVGRVAIYTQADLEAYLAQTGTDLTGDNIWFYNTEDIVFPKGTYVVDNGYFDFYLPSATGNIDFNGSTLLIGNGVVTGRATGDQNDRTVSNLTVYGTTGIDESFVYGDNYINPYTGTTKSGAFYTALYHTSNLNFENLTFNNAQHRDSHIFDVMGSDNISFDNIAVRGSALPTDLSQEYLYSLFKAHGHSVYSEAIQIDSAIKGAAGVAVGADGDSYSGFFDGSKAWADIWKGDSYDGVSSSNISITNSEFTSYQGLTGLALINGTDQTVSKYGSGIGSHTVGNTGYQGIVIDNVVMEGTVAIDGVSNNELAPIKFLNSSYYQSGASQDETVSKVDYIANDNVRDTTDISVTNVQYINTKTSDYYNPSGEDTATSVWRAYYDNDDDPTNNAVTSTVSVDSQGNVLNEIEGYTAVEPNLNQDDTNYNLSSSNFDSSTGVLTRTYDEAQTTVYDVSTDNEPVEVGTEPTSTTIESDIDGSAVTVNTYVNN